MKGKHEVSAILTRVQEEQNRAMLIQHMKDAIAAVYADRDVASAILQLREHPTEAVTALEESAMCSVVRPLVLFAQREHLVLVRTLLTAGAAAPALVGVWCLMLDAFNT